MTAGDAKESGFTFIELTAVLAIFSLVAVMSLNALSGAIRTRASVAEATQRTSALVAATELLRRDLAAMVPVTSPGSQTARSVPFKVAGADGRMSFSAAGQRSLPDGAADALVFIDWHVDPSEQALVRSVRRVGSEQPAVDQTFLTGVSNWRVLVRSETGARVPATGWRGATPYALPRGVEVRFRAVGIGEITMVVAR